jgi:hypothetical protein
MLVLDVPPWEHRDPGGLLLAQADVLRHHLPGFTVHFATWIAKQVEDHDLIADLSRRFTNNVIGYRKKMAALGGSQANTGRIIQNWAVLVTVYQLLRKFMESQEVEEALPGWQDVLMETAQTVRQERASEVFLNSLSQLLASGEAMLATNTQLPEEPRAGTTLVGYRDAQYIYLLPEVAYREINRVQPLRFSVSAIGGQLREDGILLAFSGDRHLTIQIKVRGNRVRVWRLKAETLSGDGGDCGDSTQNSERAI